MHWNNQPHNYNTSKKYYSEYDHVLVQLMYMQQRNGLLTKCNFILDLFNQLLLLKGF